MTRRYGSGTVYQLSSTPNPHGLVFARPDGRPVDGTALTRAFQAALKAAEVPSIRWHDLRHYTASLLLSEGVPMAVVSSLLGHSGIGVTVDTYGHLSEQSKREAVDKMGRAIG